MPLTPIAEQPPAALPRIDGPAKLSGRAMYTSDFRLPKMLQAVPVCASIARGELLAIDTAVAESMRGVKAVYTRETLGPLSRSAPTGTMNVRLDERRPPLEDDTIRYFGQYVGLVVAQTFEQATAAAAKVLCSYKTLAPDVRTDLQADEAPKVQSERGDAQAAFDSAEVTIDGTYKTPIETHNAIELHATVADYRDGKFTLYETSQSISNHREVMAQMLGVPLENVRVISRFLGSGFGGKLFPWGHSLLAASASRNLGVPVKLVTTRGMAFQTVGHRPATQQRVRLGASRDGKVTAVIHEGVSDLSIEGVYVEDCTEPTGHTFATKNLKATMGSARRNIGVPTSMRGPGAVPGIFALESAMDELARALSIDPVQFRLMNDPKVDEGKKLPFSSKHLDECITTGAGIFGWSRYSPQVGSMKGTGEHQGKTLGWGFAPCSWVADSLECEARVDFRRDGTVRVSTAAQDIGTGTYTVLSQMITDRTGIPQHCIEVVLGDTNLAVGTQSGASMLTSSLATAVLQAIEAAEKSIFLIATSGTSGAFAGMKPADLQMAKGVVFPKNQSADKGVPYGTILERARVGEAIGKGRAQQTFKDPEAKFSKHSFGAQFVEVTWEPQTARLRVIRVVSVIDGGRILSPTPARNQIEGAIVMGVGMALFEATSYDPRFGNPLNNSLADYMLTVNADSPQIDVTFLDYPDTVINSLGARGVGEIGLAGIAPAIANAVYHATGVRVRKLPITIEDLL